MPSSSLRIALMAPLWYPIMPDRGGIEQIIFLLVQELLSQGHEVILIATGDSASLGRLVAVYPEGLASAMERGAAYDYSYYEAAAISELFRLSNSIDLVHSHLGGALIPFGSLLPVDVLHTLHTAVTDDIHWLIRRFPHTHLSTVSHFQAAVLREVGAATVVANGIDMRAFPLCQEPDDYLLFLGRIEAKKGAHLAIAAAKALGQPLILAGSVSVVDRPYFEQEIRPELKSGLVQYVGPVQGNRKVKLLQRAKGLLFPVLRDEAFGLVMVEALACGTPVVALRRGAVSEIIIPGVNGFYGESPADLPGLVKRLGEIDRVQVRQSVLGRFSHDDMARAYVAVYHRLLQSAKAADRCIST